MPPAFKDIQAKPEYKNLNDAEKSAFLSKAFPSFGNLNGREKQAVLTKLSIGARQKPEKEVTLLQGLGNIANATGKALQAAPNAIGKFIKETPGNIAKAVQTESDTTRKTLDKYGLLEGALRNYAGTSIAAGTGAVKTLRDLLQGGLNIPSDLQNAYNNNTETVNPFQIPQVKPDETRPVSSFVGENAPFVVPLGGAIKSGVGLRALSGAEKALQIAKPIAVNTGIGALLDPQGQGLEGRITSGVTGGLLGAGGELLGVGASKVARGLKELKNKPEVKPVVTSQATTMSVITPESEPVARPALEPLSIQPAEVNPSSPPPKTLPSSLDPIRVGEAVKVPNEVTIRPEQVPKVLKAVELGKLELPKEPLSRAFRELPITDIEKQLSGLSQETLNKMGDLFGC